MRHEEVVRIVEGPRPSSSRVGPYEQPERAPLGGFVGVRVEGAVAGANQRPDERGVAAAGFPVLNGPPPAGVPRRPDLLLEEDVHAARGGQLRQQLRPLVLK
eukprot:1186522-Prorocentrum_minimum.AAC.1